MLNITLSFCQDQPFVQNRQPSKGWLYLPSKTLKNHVWVYGRLFDQSLAEFGTVMQEWKIDAPEQPPRPDGNFCAILANHSRRKLRIFSSQMPYNQIYVYQGKNFIILTDNLFRLSTQLPALALDNQALYELFVTGHILAPRTLFRKVTTLETATDALYTADTCTKKPFAELKRTGAYFSTLNEATKSLNNTLLRVFQKRLRREGSAAIMLSGGLDSVTMLDYASRVTDRKLDTLTIGVEGYNTSDTFSAEVAHKHWNTTHHSISLGRDDIDNSLSSFLESADFPGFSALLYIAVSKKLCSQCRGLGPFYFGQDSRMHTPMMDIAQRLSYLRTTESKIPISLLLVDQLVKLISGPYKGGRAAKVFCKKSRKQPSLSQYFGKLMFHTDDGTQTATFREKLLAGISLPTTSNLDEKYLNATRVWLNHQHKDNVKEAHFPFSTYGLFADFPFFDLEFLNESSRVPIDMGSRAEFSLNSGHGIPISRKPIISALLRGRAPKELIRRRKYVGMPVKQLISNQFLHETQNVIRRNQDNLLHNLEPSIHRLVSSIIESALTCRDAKFISSPNHLCHLYYLAKYFDERRRASNSTF